MKKLFFNINTLKLSIAQYIFSKPAPYFKITIPNLYIHFLTYTIIYVFLYVIFVDKLEIRTCGSVAVSHSDQTTDGPLPALLGRHVEHTLHLEKHRTTTHNIKTTLEPGRYVSVSI